MNEHTSTDDSFGIAIGCFMWLVILGVVGFVAYMLFTRSPTEAAADIKAVYEETMQDIDSVKAIRHPKRVDRVVPMATEEDLW